MEQRAQLAAQAGAEHCALYSISWTTFHIPSLYSRIVTLTGVTLTGVTLTGVTLTGVTLTGVTVTGVTLTGRLSTELTILTAQRPINSWL